MRLNPDKPDTRIIESPTDAQVDVCAYRKRVREFVDSCGGIKQFARSVCALCLEAAGGSMAALFQRSSGDGFQLAGCAGNCPRDLSALKLALDAPNALGRAVRHLQPIVIAASDGEDVLGEDLARMLGKTPAMIIPVLAASSASGVLLHVADAGKDGYGPEAVMRMEAIADELALALEVMTLRRQLADESERANDEVEKRTRELSALNDLTREISYTDDAKTLFTSVFSSFKKVLRFDAGAAIIFSGRMRKVYLKPRVGTQKALLTLANMAFDVAESLGSRKFRKNSFDLVALADLGKDDEGESRSLKTRLAAPVIFEGKLHGAIIVFREDDQPFSEDASRYLFAVTNQVSLAVRRMLIARKAQRTRLRTMLRSMVEGVLMVDRHLRFDVMNPAGEHLLSMCTASKKRSRLRRIGPMDARELLGPILENKKTTTRCEIVAVNDKTRRISISVSAVRGSGGKVNGAVIILRDVTQERMLQEQLAQAEKLSSIGEMISGVAHELNNPLTSVIGFSELLLAKGDLDASTRSDLKKIHGEAERARKIIQNLLIFARKRISRRKPVDLNYIIEKAVEFRGYELNSNNIKVEKLFHVPLPKVMADRYQLQQVFLNFIVNAQQAMKAMGGGKLTLATEIAGDCVRATVRDTGPGIPKESLGRIFDPFFTTKPVGEGTGLGLSIAYGIVSDLGGKLKVDSEPGKGTAILVELPTCGVTEEETDESDMPEDIEHVEEESKAAEGPPAGADRLGPLSVLVADDEPFILELVHDVLKNEGCVVEKATNGRDALNKIDQKDYDLVICDLKMPQLSGQDFFKFLKENKPHLVPRIMFMTGDVVSPGTRSFLKKSRALVLEKPFRASMLLKRVHAAKKRLAEIATGTVDA